MQTSIILDSLELGLYLRDVSVSSCAVREVADAPLIRVIGPRLVERIPRHLVTEPDGPSLWLEVRVVRMKKSTIVHINIGVPACPVHSVFNCIKA